jgi:hypothetical protein
MRTITFAPRAFSTTYPVQKVVPDSIKDAAKTVDHTIANKIVDGIELGRMSPLHLCHSPSIFPILGSALLTRSSTEKAARKTKEAVGMSSGKAKGKASELAGGAKGKAHEVSYLFHNGDDTPDWIDINYIGRLLARQRERQTRLRASCEMLSWGIRGWIRV